MPALLRELKPQLHLDTLTVTGRTLGAEMDFHVLRENERSAFSREIVRPAGQPVFAEGGIAFLRGNLAPGGAIIKQSAASASLLEHEGRAVVFENAEDLAKRIDDPNLDVTRDDVLILKNIGPIGAPGMPEAGYIPIPRKLARDGVKDMVRISDGRMSGTAMGTIVLHVTPEAAIGGALAAARTGDRVRLSVKARTISLLVSDEEIARRLATESERKVPSTTGAQRGYLKLFLQHVTQADQGCDFDFLRAVEMKHRSPAKR
jgi:dihydroxy-acid dehydratase